MPIGGITGIKGSGVYYPKKKIKVEEIAQVYHLDPDDIIQDHGIKEIHVADHKETEFYMAAKATKAALSDSRVNPRNIDLVIYCNALTMKKSTFPCSSRIIEEVKAKDAYGFDIDAGFIGGLIGIDIANHIVANNVNIQNAIVVASQEFDEMYLFGNDPSRNKHMIFGDGSAAVILSKEAQNNKILTSNFVVDHYTGFIRELLKDKYKSKSLIMKLVNSLDALAIVKNFRDKDVISKLTERWVANSYRALYACMKSINLDIADINHFVKTQLSLKETELLTKKLNLDKNDVYNASFEKGHLGHADILSNLHIALKNPEMRNLDIIALVAANYDCSSGAIVLRR